MEKGVNNYKWLRTSNEKAFASFVKLSGKKQKRAYEDETSMWCTKLQTCILTDFFLNYKETKSIAIQIIYFVGAKREHLCFFMQGSTPTLFTGPSSAAEGDFYFYFEADVGTRARLISRRMNTGKLIKPETKSISVYQSSGYQDN